MPFIVSLTVASTCVKPSVELATARGDDVKMLLLILQLVFPLDASALVIPSREVLAGSQLKLPCHLRHSPRERVQWFYNGTNVRGSLLNVKMDASRGLYIPSLEVKHTGDYRCHLPRRNVTSVETRVVVRTPTKTEKNPVDVDLLEHTGSVYLRCVFRYDFGLHESLNVYWMFNNGTTTSKLEMGKLERFSNQGYQGRATLLQYPYQKLSSSFQTLTIEDVGLEDDGWYSCVAETRLDKAFSRPARLDVKKKSEVILSPRDRKAASGGDVTLECLLSIDSSLVDDAQIYWTHNGRSVDPSRTKVETIAYQRQRVTYIIPIVSRRDSGRYLCHVITTFDSIKSMPGRLEVKVGTVLTEEPEDQLVVKSGTATFKCFPQTDPTLLDTMNVTWYSNGKPITRQNVNTDINEFGTILTLRNLQPEQSSRISCQVITDTDSVLSREAFLNVLTPTIIVEQAEELIEVIEEDEVSLHCLAKADNLAENSLQISWTHNGKIVPVERLQTNGTEIGHTDINIKEVGFGDDGTYICTASTDYDRIDSNPITLRVRSPSKIIVDTETPELKLLESQSDKLTCKVKVDPELANSVVITWLKNGETVHESGRIHMDSQSLILANVLPEDTGSYVCSVSTRLEKIYSEPRNLLVYKNTLVDIDADIPDLIIGEDSVIKCTADIDEKLSGDENKWKWYHNGLEVADSSIISSMGEATSIAIKNANKESHSGGYFCSIITELGQTNSSEVSMNVYYPTKFVTKSKDITTNIGDPVNLACSVAVEPAINVSLTWIKDGVILNEVNSRSSNWSISSMTREDSGIYECEANTNLDTAKSVFELRSKTQKISSDSVNQLLKGDSVTLPCDAETDPALTDSIKRNWFRNGEKLSPGEDIEFEGSSISLYNVTSALNGEYRCDLATKLDQTQIMHSVSVHESTEIVGAYKHEISAVQGAHETLSCSVMVDEGLTDHVKINWYKEADLLGEGAVTNVSQSIVSSYWDMTSVAMDDAGRYYCEAVTPVDTVISPDINVLVKSATIFLTKPTNLDVVWGTKAVFDCNVEVDSALEGSKTIVWNHEGEPITLSEGGEGNFRLENSTRLSILSANDESDGVYECQVTTNLDTQKLKHKLTVFDRTRVVTHPQHKVLLKGDSLELKCEVIVDPALQDSLDISWTHNKVLTRDMGVANGHGSIFTVDNVEEKDAGRYECQATTNLDTVVSRAAFVRVNVPADCSLSPWSSWSSCSVSCGGGVHTRERQVLQEHRHGGRQCEGERNQQQPCAQQCCTPVCDPHATFKTSLSRPCGFCVCKPGYAGPGTMCSIDSDADSWPDKALPCNDNNCMMDNCVNIPNSGQEDSDGDGMGDHCDTDKDGDEIGNDNDNCPLIVNVEQTDTDGDGVGDLCDNCINISNEKQEDIDADGLGDFCDEDIDNDQLLNDRDNCPHHVNIDQTDTDEDGVGDVCDNCPEDFNPDQEDINHNLIGDACDSGLDIDLDGIPDIADNCPLVDNADQLDADEDGIGDDCDDDSDNDGILNEVDNCPLIANPDQQDDDHDGIGDICYRDFDGDTSLDEFDTCPLNKKISKTDFRAIQPIAMGANAWGQEDPAWQFMNEGREILQKTNSAPGIAIGEAKMAGVDFEGTFFVGEHLVLDNDFIGFVFSFQDSSNFYLVMSARDDRGLVNCQGPCKQGNWQIKRVNSQTGPYIGTILSDAIRKPYTVPGETTLLWKAPESAAGWKETVSYRFNLLHRPKIGLIRLWLYEGTDLIADSGNIIDDTAGTLRGGRLGVYCDSQEQITWSALSYQCNTDVSKAVYDQLPQELRNKISVFQ